MILVCIANLVLVLLLCFGDLVVLRFGLVDFGFVDCCILVWLLCVWCGLTQLTSC